MDGECDSTLSLLPAGAPVGPYTVEGLLGAGGSAQVYRALDTRLGRTVALKVLAGAAFTPESQQRFIEEARAAASLNHPNVAVVYEVGSAGGNCFIAMEYVEGDTFRRRLRDSGTTMRELLECLRQAANAIAFAHGRGVVHCDLKPDNLMVTRDGAVKILDFGLARLLAKYKSQAAGVSPQSGNQGTLFSIQRRRVEGTPGYMSPEQAAGEADLDERTDIFSFGCMLFEAAARRLPFGRYAPEIPGGWYEKGPPDLAALCREAPKSLVRIVEACLRKDREQRCSSMSQVEQVLGEILVKLPAPGPQGVTRRKVALAGAAAATAAIAGVAGYSRWRSVRIGPSVAVIPFISSRADPEIEFLCDGLSEGIINALAQVQGLKVIARSSSFRFKDGKTPVPRMARMLGVQTLVTGAVSEISGRLRITVDLVAADGAQVWGMQYSPRLSELASVEAGISSEIAQRIGARLTEFDRNKLSKTVKVNPEAYALFLRARYHLRLYTPQSREKAAGYYEQALAIDPGFALAHAELANLYRNLGGSAVQSAAVALPRAEAAALRALAADGDLAEAHAALADIRKDQWRWDAAESGYRKALELNPNLVAARQGYAILLGVRNRHSEAAAQIGRAVDLDPLGLPTLIHAAAVHYNARRFHDALGVLNRALEIDPGSPSAWSWIGIVRGGSRNYTEAIRAYRKAFEFSDDSAATKCYYIFALARSGLQDEARAVLQQISEPAVFVPRSSLAIAYIGLNQKAGAIRMLQQAYTERDPLLQYMRVEAHFDELLNEPAVSQLIRSIGLPGPT